MKRITSLLSLVFVLISCSPANSSKWDNTNWKFNLFVESTVHSGGDDIPLANNVPNALTLTIVNAAKGEFYSNLDYLKAMNLLSNGDLSFPIDYEYTMDGLIFDGEAAPNMKFHYTGLITISMTDNDNAVGDYELLIEGAADYGDGTETNSVEYLGYLTGSKVK
jgi:hypothetical protein